MFRNKWKETTQTTKKLEGHTKITSVEKEKVKDPRRVAQGKRLAAISREAKERKAREREAAARQAQLEEKQETNENFFNASYAIIPMIGIAFGGYYFLYLRNSNKNEDREDRKEEEPKKKPNLEKL